MLDRLFRKEDIFSQYYVCCVFVETLIHYGCSQTNGRGKMSPASTTHMLCAPQSRINFVHNYSIVNVTVVLTASGDIILTEPARSDIFVV